MKHLGSLESTQEARATPRATLTHLSCSPNFPRASYLNERTLTYEPIVKETPSNFIFIFARLSRLSLLPEEFINNTEPLQVSNS